MQFLVSPTIRNFHAMPGTDVSGSYQPLWTFLNTLSNVATNIRSLYIGMETPREYLSTISKMTSLKKLELCQSGHQSGVGLPVNSTFLKTLITLENLSFLALYGAIASPSTLPSAFGTARLNNLTKLVIHSNIHELIPLLEVGFFPILRTFEWRIDTLGGPNDIQEDQMMRFFGILLRHTGKAMAELILKYSDVVSLVHIGRLPSAGPQSIGSTYPELLALSLTNVSISFPLFGSLDKSDIKTFAEAWPNIEELDLVDAESTPGLHCHSLTEVARHMPNLKRLSLTIQTDLSLGIEGVPRLDHRLRTLDVGNSRLDNENVPKIANFINEIFPRLQDLSCGLDSACASQWRAVGKTISELRSVKSRCGKR